MNYAAHSIAVNGGELHFGIWGERGPLVLASHGLTATHVGFHALADQLGPNFRLVAPDHRGRGRSRDITGPWGMSAHAQDLLAVLDHLDEPEADVLLGHSMGGFVAAVAGAQAPQRVRSILLVDGGLPSLAKMPEGLSTEALVQAIIGPSMDRLDMHFESRESYHAFWKAHPALGPYWSAYIEEYADYDLIGQAPDLHSSTQKQAILRDVETQLFGDLLPNALRALTQPVRMLTAPRGLMDAAPLYEPSAIDHWASHITNFSALEVENVNHFTIVLSALGAQALAAEVRTLCSALSET